MNIFKTKKGNIGLISDQQLLKSCVNKNELLIGYGKHIKEKNVKVKDIKVMYSVGDLISFVLTNPDVLKLLFNKEEKSWKKNGIWDGNIIRKGVGEYLGI